MKKVIIRKLSNKREVTVVTSFMDIEANTFCKFKTLTADNGSEFAMHEQITQITGAQVYFARPYPSWKKGLNEHTNGLIRRFYPKETDFSQVSHRKIAELEHTLNIAGLSFPPMRYFNALTGGIVPYRFVAFRVGILLTSAKKKSLARLLLPIKSHLLLCQPKRNISLLRA